MRTDKLKIPLHKREELRKKEEEERAKEVYEEFVATFVDDEPSKVGKTFVRGEVVNAGEGTSSAKSATPSRLYKPTPSSALKTAGSSALDQARRQAEEKARKIMEEAKKSRPDKLGKKEKEKKMSNLEAFKEELKRAQEERDERKKLRQQLKDRLGVDDRAPLLDRLMPPLDNPYLGTFDADPNTTNIFVSNISSKISEEELCRIFGHFGPLASVKIMWPRTDDERARGYNTGFIAYMVRKDAERAVSKLRSKNVMGLELKINWGKSVAIPPIPVYIPPKMLEMAMPPPPSGLPFNAQPRKEDKDAYCSRWPIPPQGAPPPVDVEQRDAWERMIRNARVKVVIPTERQLLHTIHRVVEFVVREGPIFEAMLMNKELNNSLFRFLFDNHSPAHVYYRWKLVSILQGDSPSRWNLEEFKMFEGGSTWKPPPVNFYHQGMPKELYDIDEDEEEEWVEKDSERDSEEERRRRCDEEDRHSSHHHRYNNRNRRRSSSKSPIRRSPSRSPVRDVLQPLSAVKKGQLSEKQKLRFEETIKNLTVERTKIFEAMIFCVEHAEAAEEIVDIICTSLLEPDSTIPKKIAKLYLMSDILNNCTVKVANVTYYRKHIAARLEEVFKHINALYEKIEARLKAEQFKQRIMACFRSWEDTAIYTNDFLINLQNIFLGLMLGKNEDSNNFDKKFKSVEMVTGVVTTGPGDNVLQKLVDYDLDGVPLDEEETQNGDQDEELQEEPVHIREVRSSRRSPIQQDPKPAFVKSKWEEVDTEREVARVSSRWEQDSNAVKAEQIFYEDEDIDGIPLDEPSSGTFENSSRKASESSMFLSPLRSSTSSKSNVPDICMTDYKRHLLREIEVKVVKFQDELESGSRKRTRGLTVSEEVAKYREKLLQRNEKDDRASKNTKEKDQRVSHHGKDEKSTSLSSCRSSAIKENKSKRNSEALDGAKKDKDDFRKLDRKNLSSRKSDEEKSNRSFSSKRKKRSRSRSPKRETTKSLVNNSPGHKKYR